jgi:hypothetical protein
MRGMQDGLAAAVDTQDVRTALKVFITGNAGAGRL